MTDPTVFEGTIVRRVLKYAGAHGADLARIRARSGITADDETNPEAMIPIQKACLLHHVAAEELRDPALGLSIAAESTPRDYGLIGLVFAHHPTLGQAFTALSRVYTAFLAAASLEIIPEGDATRVISRWEYDHPGLNYVRQDALAAIFVNARRASGTMWTCRAARFREKTTVPQRFHDLFGVDVVFGADEDEIIIDSTHLSAPVPNADPIVLAHLMEAAEVHLARRRAAAGRQNRLLHLQGCVVDMTAGVVRRGDESAYLTTKERELLEYFAVKRNQVVTHEEIERDVWRIGRSVVSHAPAVAIRRLRQKIEPPKGRPVNLLTVFGEGWKLVVDEETA